VRILLAGLSHRTAPLELRERFAVSDPAPLLGKLVACDEIDEAFLVSTCNRVEVAVLTRAPDAARARLRQLFRRDLPEGGALPPGVELDAVLVEREDADAVRHVFRVAASLDSMVVGEPQILGQLKDAHRAAVACGACGPILSRLLQSAFATAKRVRRDTRIGERPVSVARVAVDLARQIFEDFDDKTALLVGAGEMIEAALEALRGEGLAAVHVANRTPAHAASLAVRFGAAAHALEAVPELLLRCDVVLTCIAADAPVIDLARASEAQRVRRGRPLFVIDIGVPRNVDPDVNRLDGVYLYDIDDLAGVAAANAEERRRETAQGEAIVAEEERRFAAWLSTLQAVPTIRHLRSRMESIRGRELERGLARLGLDEAQRAGVDALTRSLVNKMLHAPLTRLREEAEREEGFAYLEAARVLFGLDAPEGGEDGGAGGAHGSNESSPRDGRGGRGGAGGPGGPSA
jgi:glutamyl-tRNA reductase